MGYWERATANQTTRNIIMRSIWVVVGIEPRPGVFRKGFWHWLPNRRRGISRQGAVVVAPRAPLILPQKARRLNTARSGRSRLQATFAEVPCHVWGMPVEPWVRELARAHPHG